MGQLENIGLMGALCTKPRQIFWALAPAAVWFIALLPATSPAQQAPDLPPGSVQQSARAACLQCHDARIIAQQRLDRAAWAKELDKMIRWGAPVASNEREAFINYFTQQFGPEHPIEIYPAVAVKNTTRAGRKSTRKPVRALR